MDSKSSLLSWYANQQLRLLLCIIDLFLLYLRLRQFEYLGKIIPSQQVPQVYQGLITFEAYHEGVGRAHIANWGGIAYRLKQLYFRTKYTVETHPGWLWAAIGNHRSLYWRAVMFSAIDRTRYMCYYILPPHIYSQMDLSAKGIVGGITIVVLWSAIFACLTALALTFSNILESASVIHLAATVITLRLGRLIAEILIILPWRLSHLPDGPAKSRIDEIARRVGYNPSHIYSDSTVQGAEHVGLFGTTLIKINERYVNQLGLDDFVGVVAHELGHWKYGHSHYKLAFLLVNDICAVAACKWAIGNQFINEIFNFNPDDPPPRVIGALVCLNYICPYMSDIIYGLGNVVNSFCEAAADRYANNLGFGRQLHTCLIKMSATSVSAAGSDNWHYAWFAGYPTWLQRFKSLPE